MPAPAKIHGSFIASFTSINIEQPAGCFLEGYLSMLPKSLVVFENQKILLLDDNRDLLQIVQIILKGQGYESVLACCIDEAVTKIHIHKPSLILMDVYISDEDGREFCSRLKNDKETNTIRVIMMSGYDNNLGMMAWVGADDFMQKPFDYNDLVTRVNRQMIQAKAWA